MKTLEQSHEELVEFIEDVIRHSERVYGTECSARTSECHRHYLQAKKLLVTAPRSRRAA